MEVKEELEHAVTDEAVMEAYPEVGGILLDFVSSVNSEAKRLWETVDLAGKNMNALCQFLISEQEVSYLFAK